MMNTHCAACGMPMEKPEEFGNGSIHCETCVFCTSQDGQVKPCAEIFQGGIHWMTTTFAVNSSLAERLTRRNMKQQPLGRTVWRNHELLQGVEASDLEWEEMWQKLSLLS